MNLLNITRWPLMLAMLLMAVFTLENRRAYASTDTLKKPAASERVKRSKSKKKNTIESNKNRLTKNKVRRVADAKERRLHMKLMRRAHRATISGAFE